MRRARDDMWMTSPLMRRNYVKKFFKTVVKLTCLVHQHQRGSEAPALGPAPSYDQIPGPCPMMKVKCRIVVFADASWPVPIWSLPKQPAGVLYTPHWSRRAVSHRIPGVSAKARYMPQGVKGILQANDDVYAAIALKDLVVI